MALRMPTPTAQVRPIQRPRPRRHRHNSLTRPHPPLHTPLQPHCTSPPRTRTPRGSGNGRRTGGGGEAAANGTGAAGTGARSASSARSPRASCISSWRGRSSLGASSRLVRVREALRDSRFVCFLSLYAHRPRFMFTGRFSSHLASPHVSLSVFYPNLSSFNV